MRTVNLCLTINTIRLLDLCISCFTCLACFPYFKAQLEKQIISFKSLMRSLFHCRFDKRRYDISAILVICLRFVSGISCGAVSPALQSLLGQWVPVYERSKLTVIVVSGQMVRRDTISKGLNARSFYSQCHLLYKLVIYHKKSINNIKSG